jgi:SAM-dependent methyltransferase
MRNAKKTFDRDYFYGRKISNYFNYDYWDNDWYWRSVIKNIKKYKIKGEVLEIGCAFGFLLERISSFFEEIYGFDVSEFAVGKAKKNIPKAKLSVGDINQDDFPYKDRKFDLVLALDVLEHTDSIENSLKKIARILKDGGYLIISVPIKDSFFGKLFNIFDRDVSHISVPDRKELFEVINKYDLTIVKKRYFFNMIFFKLPGIPVDIELLLKKK